MRILRLTPTSNLFSFAVFSTHCAALRIIVLEEDRRRLEAMVALGRKILCICKPDNLLIMKYL